MGNKRNAVERADRLISILKSIVRAERKRAEVKALDQRNIDLGIIEIDMPFDRAKELILDTFNELEIFLDHLHVTYLAASFESEALKQLATAVGEARNAVRDKRKSKSLWPVDLVRPASSFEGIHDIEKILGLNKKDQDTFNAIRLCRNQFSHGVGLKATPNITSVEAQDILLALLDALK